MQLPKAGFAMCCMITRFFSPVVLALIIPLAAFCASAQTEVRVRIIEAADSVNLTLEDAYQISEYPSLREIAQGNKFYQTVSSRNGHINIGSTVMPSNDVIFKTAGVDNIFINNRRFKGSVRIMLSQSGKLSVINYLDLEDYIKGVLFHEVSHYWPQEVLKAQAIVCRTFAMYSTQQNKAKDFDVTCDIYSQVYGGSNSERYRTSKAVDDTAGLVLTYENKIFPAYFHATCAGHTENSDTLWKIDMAPLKGKICAFCGGSPHFSWILVLPLKQIRDKLNDAGYKIGEITAINVVKRNSSGRAIELKINSADNELLIKAKDLRNLLGPNVLKSTKFEPHLEKGDAVFTGNGWGHGVGMCQWGAYFMSKRGYMHKDILDYYYPGSKITHILSEDNIPAK